MSRMPIFAANWKMNLGLAESGPFAKNLATLLADSAGAQLGRHYEVMIAPSTTHLATLSGSFSDAHFSLGAQNCGTDKFGAYTGENSPVVLKEIGCEWVILGHSERRHVYGESNALVKQRCLAALAQGLQIMLCVGETIEQRKSGSTQKVVEEQLSITKEFPKAWHTNAAIAYEPVWAIGTGETATPAQAEEVHAQIRTWISKQFSPDIADGMRILYGGSVKPENSAELMKCPNVDGFLVGGASLEPAKFAKIILNGLDSRSA